jgi:6-phosphogluconolactonase
MHLRIALLLFLLLAHRAAAGVVPFYVGTFTDHTASKGIYLCSLDTGTGILGPCTLAAAAKNPNFLTLSPDHQYLFAALAKTVGSFKLRADGKLIALNAQPSGGTVPCHVSVDATGRHLFVANYDGGNIAGFNVGADGLIGERTALKKFSGSGPNVSRQNKPYAHSIYVSPENTVVYCCDLGTDNVRIFRFDSSDGGLAPASPPAAKVPPGSGPRHLVFHPGGKFIYVSNEMGNSVSVFARDAGSGALTALETVSTMPEGAPKKGVTTAEILCHPTGKWLYVSNRGIDTISVFKIADDGRLTLIQSTSSVAKFPRSIALDPTGHWLISAGQNDNRIAVLKVDQDTGQLTPMDQSAAIPAPVCVLFVPQK